MKNFIMILASLMLFCTGCRTYVGSDDIYETDTPEVLKKETGLEPKRGVVLELKKNKCALTFASRSVTRQNERIKKYFCGRKYYYLDRKLSYADFLHAVDEPIAIFWLTILMGPFQCFHDAFYSWSFDWKLRGEHAPGIGYCIAYLPIVHLFCTSFLRPPYAYERAEYCEEEDRSSPRLVQVAIRDRLIPVFSLDHTCGEIIISHGNQTVSKHLPVDGKIEFDHSDFPDVAFDGDPLEYTIVHRNWGRRWIVRSSPLVTPAAIRDWNIFADEACDYPTRARALLRLEPKLGEKHCRKYLGELLGGDLKIKPIVRAEITIGGDPATPVVKNSASPGAGEYAIGLGYEKNNKALAAIWYRKAAERAHTEAQFRLGLCYWSGEGVTKDLAEAVKWWRKAAGHGHLGAQFKLGSCYYGGKGVTKDLMEAVKWWRKAAEQGDAEAQFKLGVCCEKDHVLVAKDAAEMKELSRKVEARYRAAGAEHRIRVSGDDLANFEAIEWYRKAAEQGHAGAQFKLGECYRKGVGAYRFYPILEENLAEAVKWFGKAAEQGHAEAQKNLEEIREERRREKEEEEKRRRKEEKEEEYRRLIKDIQERERRLRTWNIRPL